MHTNYKILALIGFLILGNIAIAHSQELSTRPTERLESVAKRVADLSSALAKKVSTSLQDVDFSELMRESEKLAQLSTIESERIAKEVKHQIDAIDFSEVNRELANVQADIETLDLNNWGEQWGKIGAAAYQEEKVIEKVYRIDGKDRLSIDNRYGIIKVNNWNRNEFKVVVHIKVGESSERRAQEALDRVSIDDSKVGNEVRFKTSISPAESGWFSALTGSRNQELSVNYEIFIPAGNELKLANQYGAIETGDREGKLNVSVRYGSLKTGKLNAATNLIAASYSNVNVGSANGVDISVSYGGLNLGEVNHATVSLSYSGKGKIAQVNEAVDISLRYSSGFSIGLGPNIKQADIAASYSSALSVSPAKAAHFNFDAAISYGNLNHGPSLIINQADNRSNSKKYSGFWNKSSQNNVSINARYGSVTLK